MKDVRTVSNENFLAGSESTMLYVESIVTNQDDFLTEYIAFLKCMYSTNKYKLILTISISGETLICRYPKLISISISKIQTKAKWSLTHENTIRKINLNADVNVCKSMPFSWSFQILSVLSDHDGRNLQI